MEVYGIALITRLMLALWALLGLVGLVVLIAAAIQLQIRVYRILRPFLLNGGCTPQHYLRVSSPTVVALALTGVYCWMFFQNFYPLLRH